MVCAPNSVNSMRPETIAEENWEKTQQKLGVSKYRTRTSTKGDGWMSGRYSECNLTDVKFLTVKNFIFDAHTKP